MRSMIGVDLQAPYHEWVVERAIPLVQMIGGQVDMSFVGPVDEEWRRRLETLMALVPEGQRGSVRLESGSASQKLVEWSSDYDLLVLGPREPTAIQRVLRGAIVQRVLKVSRCAVMVPRQAEHLRGRWKCLVGVDINGKYCREVVSMAARWTQALGGELDAVYAIQDPMPVIPDSTLRARAAREWRTAREPERMKLDGLLREGVPDAHRGQAIVARGEPEDVLGELSAGYDVVVVGNRNREGLTRFLYGAVSENISRNANCDVLTLPTAELD